MLSRVRSVFVAATDQDVNGLKAKSKNKIQWVYERLDTENCGTEK